MATGWAILHAYHVAEGNSRKWANPSIGEKKAELKDWRKSVSDYTPDID